MLKSRFQALAFPLLIVVVVLAWFSPWWLGGRVLAPLDLQNRMMSPWRGPNGTEFAKNHIVSDGVDQYLVYRLIAERNLREEGWIGWSSLTYGGTAEYANTMALYFDWTMQLHRCFDFWTAWHVGIIGQVLLAAFGMWCFLKGRHISGVWAFCGALAYAANSQFVTWIYHRWALSSFCWVPWILWAVDRYRKGKHKSWGLVPVFIAMAFLGGTLQHGALMVLAVAAMWLEEALLQRNRMPNPTGDAVPSMHSQKMIFVRYLIWGLLGTGLAGFMLIPCIDAFLISNHLGLHIGMYGNAEQGIYRHGWLQPLFNLAAYPLQIFPSILGRCDSIDVLKLFRSELFYVAYFGSLPVLVAFWALFRKKTPTLARLLIGFGLLIPLTPLARILYQRLFLLFILGGILAFAHFMEHASRETKARLARTLAWGLGILSAGWLIASLVLMTQESLLTKLKASIAQRGAESSFGYFSEWLTARGERFVGHLFIWSPQQAMPCLLLALAIVGLFWMCSDRDRLQRSGSQLIAWVVIAEVSLFASRWAVWSDPEKDPLFPHGAETEILESTVGRKGRVTTLIHPDAHMARTPFIPNTLAAYDLATITGYDSIIPDGMLLPNETPGDAARLGRLGVTHLITWPGNPDVPPEWKKTWQGENMDLYEHPKPVPRYIGLKSATDLKLFHEGGPATFVPLEETKGLENERLISVPQGVTMIRIAENEAAGWQYRIAGSQSWHPVSRGPDACMEVELDSASLDRLVELRYDPPARKLGFRASMTSMVLLLAGGFLAHRRLNTKDLNPRSA